MTGPRRYHEYRDPPTPADWAYWPDSVDDEADALADERAQIEADEAERRTMSQFDVGEWGDP